MKWIGDPKTDSVLRLHDETLGVIVGEVRKHKRGYWIAFDFHTGEKEQLSHFDKAQDACYAVEIAQTFPRGE